jgi:hypothetical protein
MIKSELYLIEFEDWKILEIPKSFFNSLFGFKVIESNQEKLFNP